MLRLRRSGAGGSARKAPPSPSRPAWARVALVALALLALPQGGCTMFRSIGNGCSPCGTGLRLPRIFNHKRSADCGPGCGGEVGAMPMESSAPVMGSPATIAPSSPGGEPDIKPIDPAPTSGSTPKTDGTSGASTKKSDYQTYRPSRRTPTPTPTPTPLAHRGGGPVRGLPPLEPTPRSASGSDPERAVATLDDPLENLPAPEAVTAPVPDSPPRPSPPDAPPAALPKASPAPSPAAVQSPSQDEPVAGAAPGIVRFYGVDPQLAGGSFPVAGGWAWLAEKRYRTVLDLREPGQMGPNDLAEISHEGFRYIALPVSAKGIDAGLLKRFDRELSQADARPLYFCDAEGARPAILWYLHRVVTEKADRQVARREAEAIAPFDPSFERAAATLLESMAPPKAALAPDPTPVDPPTTTPRGAEVSRPSAPAPAAFDPAPVAALDTADLRPYGALALAVLGVPLAFFGRSGLGLFRIKRASLPAPRRSPRSLPPASGA